MYVHVHVRTLVQVLLEEANTQSGTVGFAPENIIIIAIAFVIVFLLFVFLVTLAFLHIPSLLIT